MQSRKLWKFHEGHKHSEKNTLMHVKIKNHDLLRLYRISNCVQLSFHASLDAHDTRICAKIN